MESLDDDMAELFPPEGSHHSDNFQSLLDGVDPNRPNLFGETREAKEDSFPPQLDHEQDPRCAFNLRTIEVYDLITQKEDYIR